MVLSIRNISRPTAEQWDRLWALSDTATFYHSRWWYEMWLAYQNGKIRPDPRLVQFSDGVEVIFVAATHALAKGLITRGLSSPASTYGGWFGPTPLSDDHYNILKRDVLEQFPILIMRFNPLDYSSTFDDCRGWESEVTQLINLQKGFDAVYKEFSSANQRAVRKARKAGLSVRLAQGPEDWKAFYDIYEDTFQRWGRTATSRYFWPYFELAQKVPAPHVRLWLVDLNNTPVAGVLMYYSKTHAMYAHPATLSQYHHMRPMNLLCHDLIRQSCEEGYMWFDFGPSGGKEGVFNFKKTFGPEVLPSPMIRRQPGYLKFLERLYKLGMVRLSLLRR